MIAYVVSTDAGARFRCNIAAPVADCRSRQRGTPRVELGVRFTAHGWEAHAELGPASRLVPRRIHGVCVYATTRAAAVALCRARFRAVVLGGGAA